MRTRHVLGHKKSIVLFAIASTIVLSGCSSKPDPDSNFNPATQQAELQTCLEKLKPMVEDIERKGLDRGDYVPGSELTVKNVTFRYYQGLMWGYRQLHVYLSWGSMTPEKKQAAGPFICPLRADFTSHENAIKKEIAEVEALFKKKLSYQSLEETREEGRKALDEWDKVLRDDIADRKKKLEAASIRHTMSNRHGVRIDTYTLKSGRSIICSTTVPSTGPIMNCDGEP